MPPRTWDVLGQNERWDVTGSGPSPESVPSGITPASALWLKKIEEGREGRSERGESDSRNSVRKLPMEEFFFPKSPFEDETSGGDCWRREQEDESEGKLLREKDNLRRIKEIIASSWHAIFAGSLPFPPSAEFTLSWSSPKFFRGPCEPFP